MSERPEPILGIRSFFVVSGATLLFLELRPLEEPKPCRTHHTPLDNIGLKHLSLRSDEHPGQIYHILRDGQEEDDTQKFRRRFSKDILIAKYGRIWVKDRVSKVAKDLGEAAGWRMTLARYRIYKPWQSSTNISRSRCAGNCGTEQSTIFMELNCQAAE